MFWGLQVCKELGERLTNEEITEIVRRACQDELGATGTWGKPWKSLGHLQFSGGFLPFRDLNLPQNALKS